MAHPVHTVVRLAEKNELCLSGLLWPEAGQRLANTAYATVESVGRGQLILFATDPTYRMWLPCMQRLFLNATLSGPGMGTSQPLPWWKTKCIPTENSDVVADVIFFHIFLDYWTNNPKSPQQSLAISPVLATIASMKSLGSNLSNHVIMVSVSLSARTAALPNERHKPWPFFYRDEGIWHQTVVLLIGRNARNSPCDGHRKTVRGGRPTGSASNFWTIWIPRFASWSSRRLNVTQA